MEKSGESRKEKDSLGTVKVPKNCYWGAQTQRSKENFPIGEEKMPLEVVYALAIVKKAAAIVNTNLGLISIEKKEIIVKATDKILEGKLDAHFPLSLWQTGSGTQTNMNLNEVISNYGETLATPSSADRTIHPNDDVNRSQSSNDVFPTAMHVAASLKIRNQLLPSLRLFLCALEEKAEAFKGIVKIGRTHLMDATPMTLGQEFSGYASQIGHGIKAIENSLPHLEEIALGGTAVGTGLNAHPKYAERAAKVISEITGITFISAPCKFEALAAEDAMVEISGSLKRVACSILKIANDIRWLASGPRCGIGELFIPANEPGSSIMPGKVNPTQCESLSMVAAQVFGNDATIGFACSQGNFQLNVYRPVIIYNLLQSIRLLGDSAINFTKKCLKGIEPNHRQIKSNLDSSLMLVTALNPIIGYDKAAQIAKKAYLEEKTLKEAALELGFLSEEEFDKSVDPQKMIGID